MSSGGRTKFSTCLNAASKSSRLTTANTASRRVESATLGSRSSAQTCPSRPAASSRSLIVRSRAFSPARVASAKISMIKQIECIIERDCPQIENEGDESAETPVIWHSLYCARFGHHCEASESLNSSRRHTARHGQIDAKPAHVVDSA